MKVFQILKQEYLWYTGYSPDCSWWLLRAASCFLRSYHFRLVVLLRIRKFLPLPQFLISHYLNRTFSVEISPKAKIGPGLRISHFPGIVIGGGVNIGSNCKLFQGVLLGQSHGKYPIVGDNVTICAHACVLGNVRVGNNVIILPNSVVTKDVPENNIVGGVPAKVIKEKNNLEV